MFFSLSYLTSTAWKESIIVFLRAAVFSLSKMMSVFCFNPWFQWLTSCFRTLEDSILTLKIYALILGLFKPWQGLHLSKQLSTDSSLIRHQNTIFMWAVLQWSPFPLQAHRLTRPLSELHICRETNKDITRSWLSTAHSDRLGLSLSMLAMLLTSLTLRLNLPRSAMLLPSHAGIKPG